MFDLLKRYTQYYNRQLFFSSCLLTLSSMNYAFDNQGFSQSIALDQFVQQYGWYNPKTKAYVLEPWWLSIFNSVIFVGFAIGVFLGSWSNNRYGRRMTVSTMSCWALVCAIINITAESRWQIFAGRVLNYIYVGMEFVSIPVFQAELVPAPVRGVAVASYQLSVGFGGLFMSLILNKTQTFVGVTAFKIPFGLMFVTPAIIAPCVWLLPESPRYLISKERFDEARKALTRVRKDCTPDSIELELEQISLSIQAEKERGNWRDCFRGTDLRRTLILVGVNCFMQLTGQPFWTQYGTIFVKSLKVIDPFVYTAIFHSCNIVGNLLALFLVDRLGRRPILIVMSVLQAIFLFIMGGEGLPAKPTLENGKIIVGSVIMCGFFWNMGFASLTYLLNAEIPNQKLRDSTVRIGGYFNVITSFVASFTVPYLLDAPYADLQSKVGFIYGSFSALAAIFVYLCVPELKNRPLEEIDVFFHERAPAIGSRKWKPKGDLLQELSEMAHGPSDKTAALETEHRDDVEEKNSSLVQVQQVQPSSIEV